ncbi:class I SAM-dependent methyltransferase [Neolewinella aurantiaca]|uniref:Class I SAM-dependent methyltransferase n=1 Tax=Neolewinella aurantiaca TaxID=2602767 RepID=A0A5C7FL78_9BACT|nr:class I SAM-dependent methyltransferase [Neolewinella aurantiaca]TXF88118.1 class I SAM-dependent methyltransferase [Neolewinella aurantiaca]
MNAAVKTYYDQLAPNYDHDRFGNSYGRYIHQQETAVLDRYLGPPEDRSVLNLACGTGRFMEYCTVGADLSPQMISVARANNPDKQFAVENALKTRFARGSFDAVICFHLMMHLEWSDLETLLWEAARIVKPGGKLIFDVPSEERRSLLGREQNNWHGANAFTDHDVRVLLGTTWKLKAVRGVAAFPVHRVPKRLRGALVGIDNLLCRTPLKTVASYRVYVIEKR